MFAIERQVPFETGHSPIDTFTAALPRLVLVLVLQFRVLHAIILYDTRIFVAFPQPSHFPLLLLATVVIGNPTVSPRSLEHLVKPADFFGLWPSLSDSRRQYRSARY